MPRAIDLIAFAVLMTTGATSFAQEAAEPQGTLSLATNPRVMVYIDGQRVGMSPLLNHPLPVGEHRVTLLLIRGDGSQLRAEYRAIVLAGRDTAAFLDLDRSAPRGGEVVTLSPDEPAPTPAEPPAGAVQGQAPMQAAEQVGAWPRQSVRLAYLEPRQEPQTVAIASPAPVPVAVGRGLGLTREMVQEGMEAMRPAVEQCLGDAEGVVQVSLSIQPDGGVADVEVLGVHADTSAGRCIESALPEEAAFPIYSSDPISVVYPFRVVHE